MELAIRECLEKFRQSKSGSMATKLWKIAVAALLLILVIAGGFYYRSRQSKPLTDKDTIVLADFTNTTGDPVFDGTLRQGLASQLEQTPFLSLISDSSIAQTLTLMSKPKDAPLTPELAREVGQRTWERRHNRRFDFDLGQRSMSSSLKAVNCRSWQSAGARTRHRNGKEQVLKALGPGGKQRCVENWANRWRQFRNTTRYPKTRPLHRWRRYKRMHWASKPSISTNDYLAAIPFFQRAVTLDPNFAMAYLRLGECYQPQGELTLAAENTRKAYELRERTSDHEKLNISTFYEIVVTGNLEAARRAYELLAQTYPRDESAEVYLWFIHTGLGDYAKANARRSERLRSTPQVRTIT